MKYRPHAPRQASRERGVVLLFALIALVVLLIAAVALMRSYNTSLSLAGNVAFKRDLQNQGERAMDVVLTAFRTGALSTNAARANNLQANNYSATMLTTNVQGIPTALQSDTAFNAVGLSTNDISPDATTKIRYVIDRMCSTTGDETALDTSVCVQADNGVPSGTSATNLQGADRGPLSSGVKSAVPQAVVYRLTIRVSGPRDTRSFFQSTFSVPSS
jgi:type IV pilus assembly protein PilX